MTESTQSATLSELIPYIINIAKEAGRLIVETSETDSVDVSIKSDETPVTNADMQSHQFIHQTLSELTPNIPVLSEEEHIPLEQRIDWDPYWLIDPLDGTQEFIDGKEDFAVSIALVIDNEPVMGVVYAPIHNHTYYAFQDGGAWKIDAAGNRESIFIKKYDKHPKSIQFAISPRQDAERFIPLLSNDWSYTFIQKGSASLKACLVAEGKVDAYYRLGPTGEWDTAAAQCIIQEAGGELLDTQLNLLTYNQRETLVNPDFIVIGDLDILWEKVLMLEEAKSTNS